MAGPKKKTSSKNRNSSAKKPVKRAASRKPLTPSKIIKKIKAAVRLKRIKRITRRKPKTPARTMALPPAAPEPRPAFVTEFRPALEVDRRLPSSYGVDRLTLLVRDPWWVFAYWEITPGRSQEILSRIPEDQRASCVTVLRLYDLTGASFDRPVSFFDIELRVMADRWYVDTGAPDRSWGAEIGYRLPDGRFWALVRSNVVRTPRFGFSDVLDEEWMIPDEDFWKLVGTFGSEEAIGISSGQVVRRREFLGERFLRSISSDGSAKFSHKSGPPAKKGAR